MPIMVGETALFDGECSIQECDVLLDALQVAPPVAIDLRPCRSMHTALYQVLIAAGSRIIWAPNDEALRQLLEVRLTWSDSSPAPVTINETGARRKKKNT